MCALDKDITNTMSPKCDHAKEAAEKSPHQRWGQWWMCESERKVAKTLEGLLSGPWVPSSVLGGGTIKKAVGLGSLPTSVEAHPRPTPVSPQVSAV